VRTLELTSPVLEGADVKAAQKTLKTNKFGGFYSGEIDGEYGPITANATKDAKFYIGWQAKAVTPAYGQSLHKVLVGEVKLTKSQEQRRRQRLAVPPAAGKRRKMLAEAVSHLGEKESPFGSNICRFSKWYGLTGPWCAMFVSYCGVRAGLTAFERASHWAYCPYMVSDALAGRNGLRARGKNEAPQPGDIVLFDWGGDGVADHVGIFERGSRSSFSSIEGNTSVGNDSNGGEVMRRQRSSNVRLFCYATR
jgi:cell wall-associated NlpC family hydrolase